jgi:hypothetical protein
MGVSHLKIACKIEETNFIAPKLHWWPELCNSIIQNIGCAYKSLIPMETIFNDEMFHMF